MRLRQVVGRDFHVGPYVSEPVGSLDVDTQLRLERLERRSVGLPVVQPLAFQSEALDVGHHQQRIRSNAGELFRRRSQPLHTGGGAVTDSPRDSETGLAPRAKTSSTLYRRDVASRSRLYSASRVSVGTALAQLLGKRDNDALRPADVGSAGYVSSYCISHNQLGPVGAHARHDSVDVIDGEHDATDAQRVHRRVHGPKT